MVEKISRENNFDLIRLLAALQVVVMHTSIHLNINLFYFKNIFVYFPGVVIFFIISGFLIYGAFQSNQNLKRYFKNRFLRLYPALWCCFAVTVILLFSFHILDFSSLFKTEFWAWIAAQLTFFQFFTPDILRGWGVGTPNGSLWTIPVETQFYILLPILVLTLKKIPFNIRIISVFIISMALNMIVGTGETLTEKLFGVSIFPYLFWFLIGVFFRHNWGRMQNLFKGKALYWLIAYFAYILIFGEWLNLYMPYYNTNLIGVVSYLILAGLTISTAFTTPKLSNKLLKHNDISYGVYLYHMLIVNSFVTLNIKNDFWILITVIAITCLLAWLSWIFIEKPALSKK